MGPYTSIEEIKLANQAAGYGYFSEELELILIREGIRRDYLDRVYEGRYFIQLEFNPRHRRVEEYEPFLARNSGEILRLSLSYDSLSEAEVALADALGDTPKVVAWPDAISERAREEQGIPKANLDLWEAERELFRKAGISVSPVRGHRVLLGLFPVGDVTSESAAAELAAEIAE